MADQRKIKVKKAMCVQSRRTPSTAGAKSLVHVVAEGDMTSDAQVTRLLGSGRSGLGRADRLIIDAQGVEHADSKLIAAIISLYSQCRSSGVELELHVSHCVHAWMSVYRLDWLCDDRDHRPL